MPTIYVYLHEWTERPNVSLGIENIDRFSCCRWKWFFVFHVWCHSAVCQNIYLIFPGFIFFLFELLRCFSIDLGKKIDLAGGFWFFTRLGTLPLFKWAVFVWNMSIWHVDRTSGITLGPLHTRIHDWMICSQKCLYLVCCAVQYTEKNVKSCWKLEVPL